jgi:four helix bundle protein
MNTNNNFHVLEVALELVRVVAPLLERLDADLRSQVRRALASVPGNIAEGNRRAGGDRAYHFRVASGSSDEVRVHLRTAEAFGYLGAGEIAPGLELADRVCAMLYRLTHRRG